MDIAELLNVQEAYKLPSILLEYMLDDNKREKLLAAIQRDIADSYRLDPLRDYFQQEHGDRDKLKQDYTPDSLAVLVSKLIPDGTKYADICAGTGVLTAAISNVKRNAVYHCEELSERAIPFLLCNLALHNLEANVLQEDALTGEVRKMYRVRAGENFSRIEELDAQQINNTYDHVVMNPPYSLKWKPTHHTQYEGYEPLPTNAADYAFVLHGLHMLKDNGTLIAILPHGVLFRGNKEAQIRKKLIEKNLLDAVIGVPDNLFMNTGIPVMLLVLKKNRADTNILFIDASKEYVKKGKVNIITDEGINKIVDAFTSRKEIARFSGVVNIRKIEENDFNLNIPRYVDTYIPEPVPNLDELLTELLDTNEQIRSTEYSLLDMMGQLIGTNKAENDAIQRQTKVYRRYINRKYKQRRMQDNGMESLFEM